jgi:hypothetical protein
MNEKQIQQLVEANQLFANMTAEDFAKDIADLKLTGFFGGPNIQEFSASLTDLIQVNQRSREIFDSFLPNLEYVGVTQVVQHYDYIFGIELSNQFSLSALDKNLTQRSVNRPKSRVTTMMLVGVEGCWKIDSFQVANVGYDLFLFINTSTKLVMFQWVEQSGVTLKHLSALQSKIETLPPRI